MKYIYAIFLSLAATVVLAQSSHLLFIMNGVSEYGGKYTFSADDLTPRGRDGWRGFVFYQEFENPWYDSEAHANTKVLLEEIQVNCSNQSRARVLSFRDENGVRRPSVNAEWSSVTGMPSLQGLAFVKIKFCNRSK